MARANSPSNPKVPARGRPRREGKEPEGIVAVDAALRILKTIYDSRGPMSATELSHLTGEKPNRLHRYLVSFCRHGIVRQNLESGYYDLGPEAFTLGMSALRRYDPISGAQEAIARISAATGFPVNLFVWTPMGPTLVASEQGAHNLPITIRLGTVLPLCASATGLVFLAWRGADQCRTQIEAETRIAVAEGTLIDFDDIERELGVIRGSDIYWSNRAIMPGSVAVMPLFAADGELECCITVLVPRGRMSDDIRSATEQALVMAKRMLPLSGPENSRHHAGS
jgi:DNA-binding IclR family transcriptional regulator